MALAVNGGSELLYLPGPQPRALAQRIVDWLTRQDYTGAIFVNDALGPLPGSLPFSAIGLKGKALTPEPSIIVSFASASTGCPRPEFCAVEVADTPLQQGRWSGRRLEGLTIKRQTRATRDFGVYILALG